MENKIMMLNDDFGNCAVIREVEILPYREAEQKVKSLEMTLYSTYDDNRVYFLSMYETLEKALQKLEGFSCGTFK